MLDAFTLPENITGKNIILAKRSHCHDEEMWPLIDANRRFLRQYLFWVDKTNGFDDVAAATKMFDLCWAAQTKFAYMVLDKHSGKILGSIDIHDIDLINYIAAIGYWLRKDKTGFGYMSEAVALLEKETFARGIRRLEITCDSQNRASAGVALRCGYQYECTQKEVIFHYGEFHDREIYVKFNPKRKGSCHKAVAF